MSNKTPIYLSLYSRIIDLCKDNNTTNYNKLIDVSVDDIFTVSNFPKAEILLLISNLNNIVTINNDSYKYEKYTPLFKLIVDIICKCDNLDISTIDENILMNISIVNKGQVFLEQLKPYIINNTKINIEEIIIPVCRKGTLPTYFFWRRLLKNCTDDFIIHLLGDSCINNDIRIMKQILKDDKLVPSSENMDYVFTNIFDTRNSNKKQFKLLKLINEKIQLQPYFTLMIDNVTITGVTTINQIKKICKYYHTEKTQFTYKQINNLIQNGITLEDISDLMITETEKILYIVAKNINYNEVTADEVELVNSKLFLQTVTQEQTRNDILLFLASNVVPIYSNPVLSLVIREYTNNQYVNKFLLENSVYAYYKTLGMYTRFFSSKDKSFIRINYVLHKLRCYSKRYKKNKITEIKLITAPIISEIKNFMPNKFISVLNKGSYNYQLTKQKFTNLPPRHMIPYEINYLTNCLIKEKSDGVNVTKLPINIYPEIQKLTDSNVKAEYIEELDLYLVYDINVENMNIIERQEYLRSLHPYTNLLENLQTVTNLDELKTYIEYERNNIKNFLKSSNADVKWYPKASFRVNYFDKSFIREINNYIEETDSKLNNYINNDGIIKNDGLIITPIDGSRELKIKPKSLMTIDLLFNNNCWTDNENNIYKNITTSCIYKENKIYRCYPKIINNKVMFTPLEIRYDKKKPNTYNICKVIISIVNFNWLNELAENNMYYQKTEKVYDNKVIKILEQNKSIFMNYLKSIKPLPNKYWLDLGCGSCKLYELIKGYYPKKYTGIDIDIKSLIKAYKKHNDENAFEIHNCDLNLDWSKYNLKIYDYDFNIKYDYVVCNFSLMHFSSELFWEQLDKVTKSGTIFMFNITIPNSDFELNNSYLKSNNTQTKIFMEWIHNNPITENIITKEDINNITNKYNWNIIQIEKNNSNKLISCYNWYILQKK